MRAPTPLVSQLFNQISTNQPVALHYLKELHASALKFSKGDEIALMVVGEQEAMNGVCLKSKHPLQCRCEHVVLCAHCCTDGDPSGLFMCVGG